MNLFKKSKKKNDLPYLEVSIIRTQGNKEKIFQILEKKAKIAEKAVISFDYNLRNPILRIEYPSEKTFLETYRRDQYVYESAIKLVNLGVITPRKIKNLSKNERKNTENMYLILKYKTNYKAPILMTDEIEVGVRTSRLGNKSLDMEYLVRQIGGPTIYGEGKTVQVAYDYQTGGTIPLRPSWRERIAGFEGIAQE